MTTEAVLDRLLAMAPVYPRRIVCLTEETVETLYRLGAGDLVVGVSCFTLRPEEARAKPKVSSFLDAKFDEILALRPDLVVGFSDLQADLARELARRGVSVWIQNQRSVAEILQNVRVLGAMVGLAPSADALAQELAAHLHQVSQRATRPARAPRVFFEEWPDPLISGIRWVSELVEIAGGADVCMETRVRHDAKGRIFTLDDVAARDPEVILASWCGKSVRKDEILARPQWGNVAAVRNAQVHEIKSELILQPGPAALTDGIDAIARILDAL